MKKFTVLSSLILSVILLISFTKQFSFEKPVAIPASVQRTGDAAEGYKYLITGDYLKSGIPYGVFRMATGKIKTVYLERKGINRKIGYDFTAIKAPNGKLVVAPNCLQCHAQVFDGKLIIGLGNSTVDFSSNKSAPKVARLYFNMLSIFAPKKYHAAKNFLEATRTVGPYLLTEVQGVNAAGRLAGLLAAHRDPSTLKWSNKPMVEIPDEVVITDVPAWWLLKKKNAMFYNGYGRGDFGRFLMASNLLTVSDTSESREVDSHFNDVLAYINSIQAPKYPKTINEQLAAEGHALFDKNCAKCHGAYGKNGSYPNLLIPASIIKTDSALYQSNYSNRQFIEWFNKSWFTTGNHPARLVPFEGYIAPPLDGIWITAPYLHNGSVPTLEAVLNSEIRPKYWSRNFDKPEYDYDNPGWKYTSQERPGRNVYNTTLAGYGNYGHYFGDKLKDAERKAVIEYLKTL